MEIKRFFATKKDVDGEMITLTGDEFFHAVKVLRHKIGYKIIICTGDDMDICAVITQIGSDFLTARVENIVPNRTETIKELTLYQCVAKEMDTIIQKAVELGVKRIVPIASRYVNAPVNVERWKKIIIESSKQCGRASLTELSDVVDFKTAVEVAKTREQLILFPYEHATHGSIGANVHDEQKIGLFVGSEGGFCKEESELLEGANACTVTLGKRILRAETAVVAAIALTLSAAGEME